MSPAAIFFLVSITLGLSILLALLGLQTLQSNLMGWFLLTSGLVGFFVIVSLLIPSVIYRINVEDRLFSEHFGDHFKECENGTARLIPGVW